jgi:hypothetical protein
MDQKKRSYFQDVLHSEAEREAAFSHPYYPTVEESAMEYKHLFNALVARNIQENLISQESAKRIGEFYRNCDGFVGQGLGIEGFSSEGIDEIRELFHIAIWRACYTSETNHDQRPLEPGDEIYELPAATDYLWPKTPSALPTTGPSRGGCSHNALRSPQFTLKANKQGVINYAKGDVGQHSIYVPIKSSKETEGLVDEQMPASVKVIRAARESANSGLPY